MWYNSVFYICEDSTVSAIGSNYNYKLGDGTNIERHIPVKVKGLHDVISVNAFGSIALLSDGSVWRWSSYHYDTSYVLYKLPVDSVIQISAGSARGMFYCFLKYDKTLWMYGNAKNIPQGCMAYSDTLIKINIPEVREVRGGVDCAIALCEDSTVWTWGYQSVEGNGDTIFYPCYNIVNPQKVKSLNKIIDVEAGPATCYALKSDGTVWEWGSNVSNIIGPGQHSYPVKLKISNVKSIFTGEKPDLYAVKRDGSLWYWKDSLGKDGFTYRAQNISPIEIHAIKNAMIVTNTVYSDMTSTFVLEGNGDIWRWGDNSYGQLGNFTTFPIDSPEMMPRPCLAVDCDTITKDPDILKMDTAVYPGVSLNLTASKSEADLYWWYPRSNVLNGKYNQKASVRISDSTEFSAVIMDTYGCMRKERFVLRKKCDPNIKLIMDTISYPGSTINLKASEGSSHSWIPSTNLSCTKCQETKATIYNSVTYSVSYTDVNNCPAQEKYIIRIRDCDTIVRYVDTLKLDTLVTPGSAVELIASKANSYQWLPAAGLNCDTCQTPVARIYDNTEFSVSLTDKYMCHWTERFKITNNCDTSSLLNPKLVFDSVSYPSAKIVLKTSDSMFYAWQPSAGLSCNNCFDPEVVVTDPAEYIVSLTDSFNCISKEKFVIRIRNCDTIHMKDTVVRLDTIIHYSTEVKLVAAHSYNGYTWSPVTGLSCSDCMNPTLLINKAATYIVEISDQWHCPFYENFIINMVKIEVDIPNVFTPNGDGTNEYFYVKGLTPKSTLDIYDNNGKLVYRSGNYQSDWDGTSNSGKELGEGTYWYILNVPDNGRYQGWVYLKRN
jgi:gliding motility-associated-like protein